MSVRPIPPQGELLTREEIAAVLRISVDSIDRRVRDRKRPIPHFRIGSRILFDRAEVLEYYRVSAPAERRRK